MNSKNSHAECSRYQSMIEPFLAGKLVGTERDGFISHVRSCKSCYEELSTYHVIYSVVSQLDSNTEDTNVNYEETLKLKLNRIEETSRIKRFALEIIAIILGFCIVALVIILILQ